MRVSVCSLKCACVWLCTPLCGRLLSVYSVVVCNEVTSPLKLEKLAYHVCKLAGEETSTKLADGVLVQLLGIKQDLENNARVRRKGRGRGREEERDIREQTFIFTHCMHMCILTLWRHSQTQKDINIHKKIYLQNSLLPTQVNTKTNIQMHFPLHIQRHTI